MTQSSRYLHLPSQSCELLWWPVLFEKGFLFKRRSNLRNLLAWLDSSEMAEDGWGLTIFVTRSVLHISFFFNGGAVATLNYPQTSSLRRRISLNLRMQDGSATIKKRRTLSRCLQQHAGHVVVLGCVADEEIEFGHQALEHVGRFA